MTRPRGLAPHARWNWIKAHLAGGRKTDVRDTVTVDAFILATASNRETFKCDLMDMHRAGVLDRELVNEKRPRQANGRGNFPIRYNLYRLA